MNKYFSFFFRRFLLLFFIFLVNTFSSNVFADNEPGVSTFMYHRFDENKYPSTSVTKEQFLDHINFVITNEIEVISLEKLIEVMKSDDTFEEKFIAFSVDDAYRSFYDIAWPIFKENNIPVTLFVSTESVDNQMKGYMSWDQISSFVNEGGTVGQHTSSHLHLPLNDKETIKSDILKSHKSFVKHLGFIPKLFAYPYGETSKLVIDVLEEFGIDHSFGQHSGVTSSYSNHYYLPRFSLNENFGTIDRFIFAAKAYSLRIEDFIPSEMYLVENKKPNIEFTIIDNLKNNDLNCFSNPGGKWNKQIINKITSKRIQIQLSEAYSSGRGRLNCTTKIEDKWHWFGYQFTIK